ncbi:hypothetical protein GYMLUDRAFT_251287 [Collybiopsis luxurians FD-317 M1]|uniref:Uncharacterized protein n=1 Tax=Collybiopsis luxurians FD-317 M1 TaxID=944289 RepID=A0A0D0APW0_9AGAR|nr:hypothetical protein GYMLUDRAFT_251287 [Collybiopsis luxurians FD-317 M1]
MQAEYLLEGEKRTSEHWKHQTLRKEEEEGNSLDEESVDKMIVDQPKLSHKGKERADSLILFHLLSPSKMTTLEQRITDAPTTKNTESLTPNQPTSSKSLRFAEDPTLTDKSPIRSKKQGGHISKSNVKLEPHPNQPLLQYKDKTVAAGTPTPAAKPLPPK